MEGSMRRITAAGSKARPLVADGAAQRRQPRPKRLSDGASAARTDLGIPSASAVRDLERRLHDVEQQLQTRTRELSETQQIAKLGSFRWDVKTRSFQWSQELLNLGNRDAATFGASLEESLKSIHDEDREKVANSLIATAAGEGKPGVEFRVLLPDGSRPALVGNLAP